MREFNSSRSLALLGMTVVMALSVAACATMAPADGISRLERKRTANPASASTQRALGITYYKADRLREARIALTEAARLEPKDGTTALYLGMTAERMGDVAGARAAYSTYLSVGKTQRVRRQLEARLATLTRRDLEVAAKTAIARERELAPTPGSPRTIAVMPLSFTGADTSLRPLERGLADLLINDLARSSQLTVVERARLQAVLDEMALQRGGATDSSTNLRAGSILQAGRVVQGSIGQQGSQLRVDAVVVDVPTTRAAGSTNGDGALDQLFTLEKTVAFGLFRALGVTLTATEREAIEQRPTRSLQAFLAYSRGLAADDAGRFGDAQSAFSEAARLDPGFRSAADRRDRATAALQGASMTVSTIETGLRGTTEGAVTDAALRGQTIIAEGTTGIARTVRDDINPTPNASASGGGSGSTTTQVQRDPAADATGLDNLARRTAHITIVIQRP